MVVPTPFYCYVYTLSCPKAKLTIVRVLTESKAFQAEFTFTFIMLKIKYHLNHDFVFKMRKTRTIGVDNYK